MTAILPTSRSLSIGTTATIQPTELAYTSTQTWGETDIEALKNNSAAYNSETDKAGPLI